MRQAGARGSAIRLLAAVPFALLVWHFSFLCDDAFIAFRYARHLAEGVGLTYNPGVAPPVEGYANFAWLLWLGLLDRLGLDMLVWSRLTEAASGLVLLVLVIRVAGRWWPERPAVVLAGGLFVASLPPFAVWATGGLGTMPFALAVFLAYVMLLESDRPPRALPAGLLLVLIALLRADGWWWILLILAAAWWRRIHRPDIWHAARRAALIGLVGTICYLAWRWITYGDWLPNTAYVKVSGSRVALWRGLAYTIEHLLSFPGVAVALAAGSWAAWRLDRRRAAGALLMAWGTALYAVMVGGDFMCMGRFLVPMIPFAALLFAAAVAVIPRVGAGSRLAGLCLAAACLLADFTPGFAAPLVPRAVRARFHYNWNLPAYVDPLDQWRFMTRNVERWSLLGRALAAHTKPGESLVSGAIGAVGFYSGLFIYDRQGLVTREVARRKGVARGRSPGHDKEVAARFFLPERPTYLAADLVSLEQPPAGPRIIAEIAPGGHPYQRVIIPLDPARGFPEKTGLFLVRRKE